MQTDVRPTPMENGLGENTHILDEPFSRRDGQLERTVTGYEPYNKPVIRARVFNNGYRYGTETSI